MLRILLMRTKLKAAVKRNLQFCQIRTILTFLVHSQNTDTHTNDTSNICFGEFFVQKFFNSHICNWRCVISVSPLRYIELSDKKCQFLFSVSAIKIRRLPEQPAFSYWVHASNERGQVLWLCFFLSEYSWINKLKSFFLRRLLADFGFRDNIVKGVCRSYSNCQR